MDWPGTKVEKQQWPGTPVAAPAAAPSGPMSAMDVVTGAVTNLPSSAVQFGRDLIQPIIHPIDTATAIKDVGKGVLQKTGVLSGEDAIPHADAVGQFFSDRYGGMENLKKTLATDPVGFAADLSTVLTGGGALAARAPGMAGKVGQVVGQAGRAIDPLVGAGKIVKGAGVVGSELVGGLATHAGGEALRTAARAGAEGGAPATAFLENLRGKAPADEAVAAARQGLGEMVKQRGAAYRTEMAKLGLDTTVLDFTKIDDALIKASGVKTYKGQDLSPSTTEIRSKMTQAIQEWRALPPKDFHTPEGLDALKKKLGDIYEGTQPGTPERVAARQIYDGVRQTIIDQAPQYAKIMTAYEEASDIIKQMEKTLSLNPGASVDTSLRKLQSVLRNNVNTSYGSRKELAQYLVNAGAPNLMERLAGQALQPWLPRGLGRLGAQIGVELGLGAGAHAAGAGLGALAPGLAISSPRLMGESAYYLGKASPYGVPAGRGAFQAGREGQAQDPNDPRWAGTYRALQKDLDKRNLYQSTE